MVFFSLFVLKLYLTISIKLCTAEQDKGYNGLVAFRFVSEVELTRM